MVTRKVVLRPSGIMPCLNKIAMMIIINVNENIVAVTVQELDTKTHYATVKHFSVQSISKGEHLTVLLKSMKQKSY